MNPNVLIRPLRDSDPLAEITAMLNAAFAELARQGFNFTAATQSEQVTRERVRDGQCLVAQAGSRLVGTILFHAPGTKAYTGHDRAGMAMISQFGVHPSQQGSGLGRQLLRAAEALARVSGARELALDTSEGATALVDWYRRDGYAAFGHVQWSGKTYRSVLLSKPMVG